MPGGELILILKFITGLVFTLLLSYVTGEAFRAGRKIPALMYLAMTIFVIIKTINYLRMFS